MKRSSLRNLLHATLVLSVLAARSSESSPPLADAPSVKPMNLPPINSIAPNVPEFKPAFVEQTRAPEHKTKGAFDVSIVASEIRGGWAFEFMPELRDISAVRIWTGSRPATPDNLPYIGKLPGSIDVYAAAGHEGLGLTTSLATARLLADEIMGRKPAIPSEPYSPSRKMKEH